MAEPAVAAEPTAAEAEFQKARKIIEPLARGGKSDEDMIVKLINSGFQAKKSFKLLKTALEDLGVRMSAKDRFEQVSELLLKNDFAPTEYSEVRDVCTYLASELDATDEKQAMVAVRKYAKVNNIELPKRPKGAGGPRSAGNSFLARKYKWMIENAKESSEAFVGFLQTEGKSQGAINFHVRDFEVAKQMAEVING